jgi:UDP-N-acetylmuramoylalanine--D-glutamate ligase
MVAIKEYKNKKIAIYGMGITGQSVANVLKKFGSKLFCWDDNIKNRKKLTRFNLPTNKFWLNNFSYDAIVISPGIDINKCKIKNYLKKNSSKIVTDLDIFFHFNKNTSIISVTGTNGKSTTCKIIEKIFKEAKLKVKTLGNIGDPILSTNNLNRKKYIFILEVSSYQLQYSKLFRSKHAAILNISPDHLERHKNIKNYVKIKSKIFMAQKNGDYSYINYNNKHSQLIKSLVKKNKLKSNLVLVNESGYKFLLKKIKNNYFQNQGNLENLAFAINIAKNFKIKNSVIIKALNNFKGLPHRQENILENKDLICINDSKATSFDASLQSLSQYNNIYWIVGGLSKFQDKFYLKNIKKRIIKVYIIGKNPTFFIKQLKNKIPYTVSRNLKDAVNLISKDITNNKKIKKTVLLSPAAASFDQFDNFERRGDLFKKIVNKKLK